MSEQYFVIQPKTVIDIDLERLKIEYVPNDEEQKFNYNPFNINELQAYNPVYSSIFNSETITEETTIYSKNAFIDMATVIDYDTKEPVKKNIFIKFSPLLDNLRYLMGKYETDGEKCKTLPDIYQTRETIPKLRHIHNTSYIDNFFCYLTSIALNNYNIPNGIDYYGSYLGIQYLYKSNVVDDLDYLTTSQHFLSTKGEKYFMSEKEDPYSNYGSRSNKKRLLIDESSMDNDIDLIVDEIIDANQYIPVVVNEDNAKEESELTDELIYMKEKEPDNASNSSSHSTNSSNNSELNYSSDGDSELDDDNMDTVDDDEDNGDDESCDEDDDDMDISDSDESSQSQSNEDIDEDVPPIFEEEKPLNVYIKDFPTQMIILEKCEGTLDSLFIRGIINEDIGLSMLMQIIMTLLIYQKMFHFTHNDLHTNNIMYVRTQKTYLYYKYQGIYFKVPTHGYIYKIIDFGRSIYKYNGQVYCSDSFAPTGDAYGQYNFEPFMNQDKPRLEPNYSFDLCRLACSIYDFIFEDQDEYDSFCESDEDRFISTIIRWIKDKNGKNILYKRNGEERYPNFKLYKMITRIVDSHTPQNQLNYPEFNKFATTDISDADQIVDIDVLPVLC